MSQIEVVIDALTTKMVLDVFANGTFDKTFRIANADPQATAQKIAERDLAATTLDELLGGGDNVISGKNFTNRPFKALSVEWQLSDIEGDGLPFYAVIHAATLDGEVKVITCGANTVVRKLAVMDANGWFPAWIKIVKGNKTEAGYEPLDVVKAPSSDIPFGG